MISPPKRWPDSVDAPPRIGELLRRAARPTAIPDAVRARSLARVMGALQEAEPREARPPIRSTPLVVALAMVSAAALAGQVGGHMVRGAGALPPRGEEVHPGATDVARVRAADARPGEHLVIPARRESTSSTSEALEPAPAAPEAGLVAPEPTLVAPEPTLVAPSSAHLGRAFHTPRIDPAAAGADTLLAESKLLESARRSLETSPSRALVILDGYRARYPAGQLADEGEFLAIRALMALGRADQATARLHHLEARSGGSLYATELRKWVSLRSFEGTARP